MRVRYAILALTAAAAVLAACGDPPPEPGPGPTGDAPQLGSWAIASLTGEVVVDVEGGEGCPPDATYVGVADAVEHSVVFLLEGGLLRFFFTFEHADWQPPLPERLTYTNFPGPPGDTWVWPDGVSGEVADPEAGHFRVTGRFVTDERLEGEWEVDTRAEVSGCVAAATGSGTWVAEVP